MTLPGARRAARGRSARRCPARAGRRAASRGRSARRARRPRGTPSRRRTMPSGVVPESVTSTTLGCPIFEAARASRLQPLDEIRRLAVRGVQDLERDPLADLDVLGLVDAAHAALAAQPPDAVAAADHGADHRHALASALGADRRRSSRLGCESAAPASRRGSAPCRRAAVGASPMTVPRSRARGRACRGGPAACDGSRRRLRRHGGGRDGRRRRPRRAPAAERRRRRLHQRGATGCAACSELARLDHLLALAALALDVLAVQPGRNVATRTPSVAGRVCARNVASRAAAPRSPVAVLQLRRQRLAARSDPARPARATRASTAARPRDCARAAAAPRRWARPWRRPPFLPDGNSCRPVSSSHRMMPAAYRSVRPSSCSPRACSGRHVADLAVDDARRGLLHLQRRRREPEVGEP